MKHPWLATAAVILLASSPAFAFRCGDKLVHEGDTPIEVRNKCGEPTEVTRTTILRTPVYWWYGTPIQVSGDLVPRAIDELPVIAIAAAHAEGTTVIRDAAELRVKESDRIATIAGELRKMGAVVRELPDGMEITGKERLAGAVCESHGDHRIAMSMAMAGLAASGETTVKDTAWIETSFPGFERELKQLAY